MEDGNVRFYVKGKVQHSRIAFCLNLAQLFILYPTTPWKIFPSKNTRALICFSSTIDENTDTVNWRICFLMNQSRIMDWEGNNHLINYYLTNYSEEINNANWLGNTYLTNTKETFS